MITAVLFLFWLAIVIVVLAGFWKTFEKAGQPGWAAIIPIYNYYIMLKIGGKPGWWLLLFLIPIVNIVMIFVLYIEIARRFGQSTGFGIGFALLGFVFWPILGFGEAKYFQSSIDDDINSIGNNPSA